MPVTISQSVQRYFYQFLCMTKVSGKSLIFKKPEPGGFIFVSSTKSINQLIVQDLVVFSVRLTQETCLRTI